MPVVTIRGQLGSGATDIGREVARIIRGDYVDREILEHIAHYSEVTDACAIPEHLPFAGGAALPQHIGEGSYLSSNSAESARMTPRPTLLLPHPSRSSTDASRHQITSRFLA